MCTTTTIWVTVFAALTLASADASACCSSSSVARAESAAKTITLDVVDAEVTHVLRLLAGAARVNLVVDDAVKGKVTLRLRNVPWDAALRAVLATKGLGAVFDDNILRVAPLATLDAEELRRLERANDCEEHGPLVTRVIPVSYASASELKAQVAATLSKRGTVAVDERTNTLIVRDVRCP